MLLLVLVLLGGLVLETIGVIYTSIGLKRLPKLERYHMKALVGFGLSACRNSALLVGVFFQALYFFSLLYLLAEADISFVWPLTSLGFVSTTVAAYFFLGEKVPLLRWVGVLLIMLGAAVVTYTETQKPKAPGVQKSR